MAWSPNDGEDALVTREWLVTNGRGGYASSTVAGAATRRYHGLLIAALPAPLGRTVMLNHLVEELRLPDGTHVPLGCREDHHGLHVECASWLREFWLEDGLPVWRFEVDDCALEKRVLMPHRQNTVFLHYRLLTGSRPARLRLRPSVHFRPHEAPVSTPLHEPHTIRIVEHRYELSGNPALPPLRLRTFSSTSLPAFVIDTHVLEQIAYRTEAGRGYESTGELWSPGYFRADLAPGGEVALVASVEEWDVIDALDASSAFAAEHDRRGRLLALAPRTEDPLLDELVLAADQFVISPSGRVEDAARAQAAGEELRTVIAGYHWFTDWGRDTMISLEGLTLCTGRMREAAFVLRTFAHYVRDGLIPNMFPDHAVEGLYHTADATLWYFHAIDRYLTYTGDRYTLDFLLPRLFDIVQHHMNGTRFGIGVDPRDGLLGQGADGYQLTWMDAKVDGWVVTPRRGKAVEINALWYNALRLLEQWSRTAGLHNEADRLSDQAERAYQSFNRRFWFAGGGYLYDVVDGENGNDPACRPNQVLAIALRYPVLDSDRWHSVMQVVREQLLTPFGLRSLSPLHPDYKPRYFGDLRARDAAYHQGTVWAWLIGPYVDAWLKLHPEDSAGVRQLLAAFDDHLNDFGTGSIAEIFDAEPPFTARGCIAQAWSVAEVLRCLVKLANWHGPTLESNEMAAASHSAP
ncbi:MAG: amylo-alpha-1,6-glucosidase [Longimicrobiales bacterium]